MTSVSRAGRPLGVILAGGGGRRMGGADKALIRLGGAPLLAHVVERLAPQVAGVALNANGDPARFAGFGLPVLPDELADTGPLTGVLAGLDWAERQGADAIVTVAVDTPFFPSDLVSRLVAAGPLSVAATDAGGLHPVFGLWPVTRVPALRESLAAGKRRIGAWAREQGAATAVFPDEDAFLNINTAADLARAEARLA